MKQDKLEQKIEQCIFEMYNAANTPEWNVFGKRMPFNNFEELLAHCKNENGETEFPYECFFLTQGKQHMIQYQYEYDFEYGWLYNYKLGISKDYDDLFIDFAEAYIKTCKDVSHHYLAYKGAVEYAEKKYAEKFKDEFKPYINNVFENEVSRRNFRAELFKFIDEARSVNGPLDIYNYRMLIDNYDAMFRRNSVDSVFDKYHHEMDIINRMHENNKLTNEEYDACEYVIAQKYGCEKTSRDKNRFEYVTGGCAPTINIEMFRMFKMAYRLFRERKQVSENEEFDTKELLATAAKKYGVEHYNEAWFEQKLRDAYIFEKSFEN